MAQSGEETTTQAIAAAAMPVSGKAPTRASPADARPKRLSRYVAGYSVGTTHAAITNHKLELELARLLQCTSFRIELETTLGTMARILEGLRSVFRPQDVPAAQHVLLSYLCYAAGATTVEQLFRAASQRDNVDDAARRRATHRVYKDRQRGREALRRALVAIDPAPQAESLGVPPPNSCQAPAESRAQRSLEEIAGLLQSLRPELVNFLEKQLPPEDAKDTASQLIHKMLARAKRRKRFRLKPVEQLRKYAYGAAKKMASSAHRDAQRRLERDEAFRQLALRAEPLLPDAIVAASELLALLPLELAEPCKLCELEGLSHEEAAKQLGLPVGTLKSRLRKARRLLARENAKREIFRNRNRRPRS